MLDNILKPGAQLIVKDASQIMEAEQFIATGDVVTVLQVGNVMGVPTILVEPTINKEDPRLLAGGFPIMVDEFEHVELIGVEQMPIDLAEGDMVTVLSFGNHPFAAHFMDIGDKVRVKRVQHVLSVPFVYVEPSKYDVPEGISYDDIKENGVMFGGEDLLFLSKESA